MNFTAERLLSLEFSCLNLLKCKALYFVCNAVCDLLFKLGSQRDLFMAPVYVYRTRGICVVALTVHNYVLDNVQDFLIKLVIKPRLHILKISIFSLNHVILRPTKIMNNLLKVCKICTFQLIFRHQKTN